ncbi:MAG: nucleoside monophosphate kinase [Chloroflexota bacterium]
MGLYIIMMGVQGAGKGMQAGIIQEKYGIPQVSTGDLFRAMKHRNDPLALEVQGILERGDLVSDNITCRMVEDRLAESDAANGVILDGFPRNPEQVKWLKDHLTAKGESITAVLLLELDLYTAFRRAFGRIKDDVTGESLNVFFNNDGIETWRMVEDPKGEFPPRLEATLNNGNPVIRRADDANAFSIINRIDTYMDTTMPLIEQFDAEGLVVRIDANQSIEDVKRDIAAAIEARYARA